MRQSNSKALVDVLLNNVTILIHHVKNTEDKDVLATQCTHAKTFRKKQKKKKKSAKIDTYTIHTNAYITQRNIFTENNFN